MRSDPKAEGKRWLEQAKADIEDARILIERNRYNTVCFTSQQAAEKALKAYLFFRGANEVWGHSAAELCERCGEVEPSFNEPLETVSLLDKYYIPTRYPNGLPGGIPKNAFDDVEARRALKIAEDLIEMVASLIE